MTPTVSTEQAAPESLQVTTSQGSLTIHRMSWQAWKKLKGRALSLLKRPEILQAIEGGFAAAEAASKGNGMQAAADILSKGLPAAADLVVVALDESTEELVADCHRGNLPDGLTALDWITMRGAVLTVNNPVELLQAEKNSMAGVLANLLTPAESSPADGGETPSSPHSTSSSKPNSFTPAGAAPTS